MAERVYEKYPSESIVACDGVIDWPWYFSALKRVDDLGKDTNYLYVPDFYVRGYEVFVGEKTECLVREYDA